MSLKPITTMSVCHIKVRESCITISNGVSWCKFLERNNINFHLKPAAKYTELTATAL